MPAPPHPDHYYDLLLGTIPVSFILAYGTISTLTSSVVFGVIAGGAIAIACILHGLFVNPPIGARGGAEPETGAAAGVGDSGMGDRMA